MVDVTDEEWHDSACGATHKPKTLDDHAAEVKRARLARGRGLSPHGFADALDITDAAYDAFRQAWLDLRKAKGELEEQFDKEREARVKAEDRYKLLFNKWGMPGDEEPTDE